MMLTACPSSNSSRQHCEQEEYDDLLRQCRQAMTLVLLRATCSAALNCQNEAVLTCVRAELQRKSCLEKSTIPFTWMKL